MISSPTTGGILCPHCLQRSHFLPDESKCDHCEQDVSGVYLDKFRRARPLTVPILGWSGHGRSSYLAALFHALTRLNQIWPSCHHTEADERTRNFIHSAYRWVSGGSLGPTELDRRDRLALFLQGWGLWGDLGLIFEETSGKHFDGFEISAAHRPFLVRSPYALMIVSRADLAKHRPQIEMLLGSYLGAIREQSAESRRLPRRLVVALSKSDLLCSEQVPGEILDHLRCDPDAVVLGPGEVDPEVGLEGLPGSEPGEVIATKGSGSSSSLRDEDYLKQLGQISESLQHWLDEDAHFRNLRLQAEDAGIELQYSIFSSHGISGATGDLPVKWQPRRILDPLLWLLEFEKTGQVLDFVDALDGETPRVESVTDDTEPVLAMVVKDIQGSAPPQRVALRSTAGNLEKISLDLASVSFRREPGAVLFKVLKPLRVSIRRDGELWKHGTASALRLSPGDTWQVFGWQIHIEKDLRKP